jgi:hypothetical protein
LIVLGGIISLCIILGCSLPVISQEVLGIIGVMVESGQDFENAKTYYSLFSIVKMLYEQADFTGRVADYVGLGSLSILLIVSVLLVPIAQTCTVLYQWLHPMTQRKRRRVSIAVECLEAWQYSEVFLLAVVIASWQLGQVSEFMVGSNCEALKDTFAQLVYFGILKPEDGQCFRVDSSVEAAAFILAAAALLLSLLTNFVKMAGDQYARDMEELTSDRLGGTVSVDEDDEDVDDQAMMDQIRPVPVLFTDRFRWMLVGESEEEESHDASGGATESDLEQQEKSHEFDEQRDFSNSYDS